jgi:hypothetical protein
VTQGIPHFGVAAIFCRGHFCPKPHTSQQNGGVGKIRGFDGLNHGVGSDAKAIVLTLLSLLIFNCQTNAQPLYLPLEGFYHPGRAMPVRWDAPLAGGSLALSATGAVTTRILSLAQPHGAFPWLAINSNITNVSNPHLPPLHPLADDDLLIINTLPNDQAPTEIFPHRSLTTIHLTATELVPNPMAWQTVDAIILDPQTFENFPSSLRNQFLAEGITLAVPGPTRPEINFSWQHQGNWWLASAGLNLPPIISPDVDAPTFGWTPGRSPEFRRRIFLFATIYCLLIAGIALWPSRWMLLAIIAVTIASSFFFALDNRRQSPIARQSGTILIDGPVQLQDSWLFQLSHRAADFRIPIAGSTQPIVSDPAQLNSLNLTLDCDPTGQPIALTGRLSPDKPLALMQRRIAQWATYHPSAPSITSPLRLLVTNSIYPGFTAVDQLNNSAPQVWPTLILRKD